MRSSFNSPLPDLAVRPPRFPRHKKREPPATTPSEGLPQPRNKDSPADSHKGAHQVRCLVPVKSGSFLKEQTLGQTSFKLSGWILRPHTWPYKRRSGRRRGSNMGSLASRSIYVTILQIAKIFHLNGGDSGVEERKTTRTRDAPADPRSDAIELRPCGAAFLAWPFLLARADGCHAAGWSRRGDHGLIGR